MPPAQVMLCLATRLRLPVDQTSTNFLTQAAFSSIILQIAPSISRYVRKPMAS